MDKNAIGYNDLCEAVGKATLNLVSYKQEVTKEYIISMLESFAQIEYDEKRRATYIMAAEGVRAIKTPLGGGATSFLDKALFLLVLLRLFLNLYI